MSIDQWSTNSCPEPRLGYAIYYTGGLPCYHAMIAASGVSLNPMTGTEVRVSHMGPPLEISGNRVQTLSDNHWIGSFPELTADDYSEIRSELVRIEQRMPPNPGLSSRYDLGVHGIAGDDPNDAGEAVVFHCSCASLVEHCYQQVDVDLVEEGSIPEVTQDELATVLKVPSRGIDLMLRKLNTVSTHWPCKVLLPAYQMRAFEKGRVNTPHQANLGDHPFP
jgi:hypothetical protein